jgi:Kef-type K+ transport system membrane component KefB
LALWFRGTQTACADVLAAIVVNPGVFLAILAAAAVAGTLGAIALGHGIVIPVVVLELLLGVVIGPHGLGLHTDTFVAFFSDLGLGMLFFFAGYEIDLHRISGRPLRLALVGWGLSLALAYTLGGVLAALGIVLSLLYTGSALATTAIGTLLPILSDSGEMRTRFGTYLLAAGAVGEFGPILLLTLILSSQSTVHNALILIAFVGLAVGVAIFLRGAILAQVAAAVRAHAGKQLAACRALDPRAHLRALVSRLQTRSGPPARRLRRGSHHAPHTENG